MKEKPGSIRTYDEEGYRRRAACLCFRDATETEVLLVSSTRHGGHWVVPGGGVEPHEEVVVAAKREVLEEAGVLGEVIRCLGVFSNELKRNRTTVFVLIVDKLLDVFEEDHRRRREYFPVPEAMMLLSSYKPVQRDYFEHLSGGEASSGEPSCRQSRAAVPNGICGVLPVKVTSGATCLPEGSGGAQSKPVEVASLSRDDRTKRQPVCATSGCGIGRCVEKGAVSFAASCAGSNGDLTLGSASMTQPAHLVQNCQCPKQNCSNTNGSDRTVLPNSMALGDNDACTCTEPSRQSEHPADHVKNS